MEAYSSAWLSLALVLTGLLGVLTYLAWRSRGAPALVRGAGITLLPLALYFTGTLRLVGTIVDEVGSYVGGLVFSPRVWTGVVLAIVAVLLIAAGGALRSRTGAPPSRKERRAAKAAGAGGPGAGALPASAPAGSGPVVSRRGSAGSTGSTAPQDDELDDIEALLRKRGIS